MTAQQQLLVSSPSELIQLRFEFMVRRMTFLLVVALGIEPEKDELVTILGNGHERDNVRAIQTWVRKRLCCMSCALTVGPKDLYAELSSMINKGETV